MKIAITSDVHLEFGDLEITNDEGAHVLILSGDIVVAKDVMQRDPHNVMGPDYRSNRYHDFFQRCHDMFPKVVYVVGNHEHYHGDFATTIPRLKEMLSYLPNLHILDKESIEIDDVTFVGGTLWTDMNREDPHTLERMSGMMNDFRCVANNNRKLSRRVPLYKKNEDGSKVLDERGFSIEEGFKFKEEPSTFSPQDAVEDHKKFLGYIESAVVGLNKKFVVVGHHAPSRTSTHPRYAEDTIMNGGYSSSLDEFILDNPQIKLWTHGHTHEVFDYMIGSTRIVCNPRGYIGHEQRAVDWKLKYVEVI